MKKFLALVLALVMTMSLVTISAGAEDFTDDASIAYDEAVDVMTAIGVVGGYADGSFNPQGTLTRGAAAKIICNMILGPTTADALATVEAPFVDVPANHVFSGYIAYCVSEGIVSGYTDGTFRPADTLTGYAFMKMLLGALGYDAATEGYTGANFAVNVAKRALNIGLDAGLEGDFVGSKALTREEACLYAFNTLKATMVDYDNNSSIKIGDVVISNSSKATEVVNKSTTYVTGTQPDAYVNGSAGTMQFCEQYFKDLKLTVDTYDQFGRPNHSWVNDTDSVGAYADKADVVFTAATKAADVATALNGYKLGALNINNVATVASASFNVVHDNAPAYSALSVSSETLAQAIADETANGKLVEIYANSYNVVTDIVEVTYSVGKVTNVVTAKDRVTYTIDNGAGSAIDYVDPDVADTIKIEGTIAKGDTVTFVKPAGGKLYVYTTETFSGAQSSITNENVATIDGAQYTVATGVNGIGSFNNSASVCNYWLDQYGFLVKTTAAAASTDYAYIVGAYGELETSVNGSVPSAEVKVVLADGTIATYDLQLTKLTSSSAQTGTTMNYNGNTSYVAAAGDYIIKGTNLVVYSKAANADVVVSVLALLDKTYGYTISGEVITLESLTALPSTDAAAETVYAAGLNEALAKNKTSYATYSGSYIVLADSAVTFVVYNSDKGTTAVYTGAAGLPATANGAGYAVVKSGKVGSLATTASVVFVEITSAYAADTVEEYVYIDNTEYTYTLVDGANKYNYTGIKADGTEVALAPMAALGASGLYQLNADNTVDSNALRTVGTDTNVVVGLGNVYGYDSAMAVNGNMLYVDGAYFNMANAQVVYVDDTLAEVDANGGYFVVELKDGVATSNVEAIFVVAD